MTQPTTTQPASTHPPFLREVKDNLTRVAIPYHEPPAVVLRRRIAVAVVVVLGAALLGYSLARHPGDSSFYGLTLALAGVWALGALVSRPLHLGHVRFFGRNQRPVISGTVIGLALGGVFVLGGLVAREIPPLRDYAVRGTRVRQPGQPAAGRVHHRDQRSRRGALLPRRAVLGA